MLRMLLLLADALVTVSLCHSYVVNLSLLLSVLFDEIAGCAHLNSTRAEVGIVSFCYFD